MPTKNRITFYACGNGDASLIEAHGLTIMTDIHYRSDASDDENDEIPDFAPKIRDACDEDYCDVFVLTHDDDDHVRGFSDVFHIGPPADRVADPDEGEVKIIANEIWCSSYCVDLKHPTDAAKPLIDEIKRRNKLTGDNAQKDGNRLVVKTAGDGALQELVPGIDYAVLAPNTEEADIEETPKGEESETSNPSSLVVQWNVTVVGKTSKVILAGDSTVKVWERLHDECADELLEWHILLAPHHCSRHSMGTKDEDEVFSFSDNAIAAVSHQVGEKAHVVSSSRKFGKDHPPHPDARDKYYDILADGEEVTDDILARFRVTDGEDQDDPEDVRFNFTSSGPTRAVLAAPIIITTPSSSGGGGYGR